MADRKRMQFDSKLSDAEWIRLLGEMWDLPAVDLDEIEVVDEVLAIIPKELARRRSVFPVSLVTEDDEEELILAVADPSDVAAREEAAFVSGREIVVVVSTHEHIDRAIARSYDRGTSTPESSESGTEPER